MLFASPDDVARLLESLDLGYGISYELFLGSPERVRVGYG